MVAPMSAVPSTRIKGVMNTFDTFYDKHWAENPMLQQIKPCMDFIESKNDARTETFMMLGAPPGFERWDEDAPRVAGSIQDQSWEVPVLKWQAGVEWKRIDEEDDLTSGRFRKRLEQTAEKAVLKDVEIFFQLLQASVSAKNLPGIPTCADGLALFSTSRVLMSPNGNVVNGSGVRTVHQFQRDFYEVLEKMQAVTDDKGDYYFNESDIMGRKIVFANPANRQRMQEAFKAKVIASQGAGVENILASTTDNITMVFTPRVTGNSWYVFLENVPAKPIFALTRKSVAGVEKIYKDESNSDRAEASDTRRIVFRYRKGYGYSLPIGAWQVSN